MGLMKTMSQDAKRVKSRPSRPRGQAKREGMGIVVTASHPEFDKQLAKLPSQIALNVMVKAVREASKVVAKQLRTALEAHDSDRTGTNLLQSWRTFEKREAREYDLRSSIHYKVKRFERGGRTPGPRVAGFVGPRRPWGNHANLLEFGGNRQLWGGKWITVAPTGIFRKTTSTSQRAASAALLKAVRRHRFDA